MSLPRESRQAHCFCLFIVASLAIGCAGPLAPTWPSSITADQLSGTWNLSSMQTTGQPQQATPAGASYTLTFDNGRLSTRADCNVCSGAFTLSGRTLTVDPVLAC